MFIPIQEDKMQKLKRAKTIAAARLAGIAVIVIDPKTDKMTGYWHEGDMGGFVSSRDERSAEYPKLYKRTAALFKRIEKLNALGYAAKAAFWLHDDFESKPLERYALMETIFPGGAQGRSRG